MELRQTQILEIINQAEKFGVDPNLFKIDNIPPSKSRWKFFNVDEKAFTNISVKDTNYYFKFKTTELFSPRKRYTEDGVYEYNMVIVMEFSPGKEKISDYVKILYDKKDFHWNGISDYVFSWLKYLSAEIQAISTIGSLITIPNFINYENNQFEDYFTESEKEHLRLGIQNLKHRITIEFDLTDYKLNLINRKLDELTKNLDKLNRFDFKTALFGLMVNLSSSVLYDHSGKFWNIVKTLFPKAIK